MKTPTPVSQCRKSGRNDLSAPIRACPCRSMSVHAVHAVQCPTPNPQPSTSFALRNTHGFWELTFDGHSAILRQHPALFYVAWLLAHPPAAPVPAHVLAAKVADLFAMHSDFFRTRFWIALAQEQFAQVLV